MNTTAVVERIPNPVAEARLQLQQMEGQFKAALPAHIPVERFARVVMTAIQNNPNLVIKCTRQSLWNASMKAAQDGLLPDGREGAIVEFGPVATWMPMIAGLRKKVRNSDEIATWDVFVVHANDQFDFQLGDDPFIAHKPTLEDPGPVVAAYSIAVLKSGEKTREVMSVSAIEKVRQRSRAKNNGPWVTDYEEMCRKTVARRHFKVLPASTDLDDLIRRDDALYDMEGAKDEAQADRPKSLSGRLDALARVGDAPAIDAEQAEAGAEQSDDANGAPDKQNTEPASQANVPTTGKPAGGEAAPAKESPKGPAAGAAEATGNKAKAAEQQAEPKSDAEYSAYCGAWIGKATDAAAAEERWKTEKALRRKCVITQETFEELETALKGKVAELRGG